MAGADPALIRAAFDDVLDQPEPNRAAYLAEVYSGRPEIVHAVQELLSCHIAETQTPCHGQTDERQAHVFSPAEMVAGRFRIVRFIGAGGMGQVYEAYDEKIAVSVALKTLHPNLAGDAAGRERIRREIRVARQVSHQNLCRVFDLVEHRQDGKDIVCLSMELLHGETLFGYIARNRPLPAHEALALLRPIAEVLSLIHEHGIVHRDLKPANIILVPGRDHSRRVVVTDLGLARPLEGAAALFESPGDARAGSPYFMAPELWNGTPPGVASDLYALALIADEMVTRSPAFDTASLPAFYYAKFREGPVPPGRRADGLPAGWERAILRSLGADTATRPPSATKFLAELESSLEESLGGELPPAPASPPLHAAPPPRKTIAVMPFSDLSVDRDQAYFCDGLTEELIHLLSQAASLRVVSRGSVFEARRRGASAEEMARDLGVTYVLLGSVRKEEKRLRVTVQLVDSAEGCNLWSQRFDREMTDAIAIQEEIAAASLDRLQTELQLASFTIPQLSPTTSMVAYNAYLEGLFEFNRQTLRTIQKASACFERATAADPAFAPAYSGLADCCCAMEWYGQWAPGEAMPMARRYAERALELNGTLANAHCTIAVVKARYEWDWRGASDAFRRTLVLNPSLSRAYFSFALDYLTPMGRLEEALRTVRYALQLDPLSPLLHTALGGCLYRLRQYEPALASLKQTLEMSPDFYHAHWSAARVLERLGRYEEAISEYEEAIRRSSDNAAIQAELGHCYGAMGDTVQADALLQQLETVEGGRYRSPLCAAFVHLGLARPAEAIQRLNAALADRTGALIWIAVDPRFDSLRREAGFQNILAAMGIIG